MKGIESISIFKLVARFFHLVQSFAALERDYSKQATLNIFRSSQPALFMSAAGIVICACAGAFFLAGIMMLLNTWFLPWVSSFIMGTVLLSGGACISFLGIRALLREFGRVQSEIERVRKDMRWLKRS